jgi:hypothetical protein
MLLCSIMTAMCGITWGFYGKRGLVIMIHDNVSNKPHGAAQSCFASGLGPSGSMQGFLQHNLYHL